MLNRFTYAFIIVAGLLMTACSVFDDHMYGPEGEHLVKLSFTLALGSSDGPLTRAETWDPNDPVYDGDDIGYDPKLLGDSYDNTIDPTTLQVVFYEDGDNEYIITSSSYGRFFKSELKIYDSDTLELIKELKTKAMMEEVIVDEDKLITLYESNAKIYKSLKDNNDIIISDINKIITKK